MGALRGAPLPYEPLAVKARGKARLILVGFRGAVLFAGCALAWGFVSALAEILSPENQLIPTTE